MEIALQLRAKKYVYRERRNVFTNTYIPSSYYLDNPICVSMMRKIALQTIATKSLSTAK